MDAEIIEEGLNYLQARALEQAYIMYYLTLNPQDKAMNQINGINFHRTDAKDIMKNGYGFDDAIDNLITNKILCLLE